MARDTMNATELAIALACNPATAPLVFVEMLIEFVLAGGTPAAPQKPAQPNCGPTEPDVGNLAPYVLDPGRAIIEAVIELMRAILGETHGDEDRRKTA